MSGRDTVSYALTKPTGIAERAVWWRGVLNASATKGISAAAPRFLTCERSSGGKGPDVIFGPLTPARRRTLSLSKQSRAGEDAVRLFSRTSHLVPR